MKIRLKTLLVRHINLCFVFVSLGLNCSGFVNTCSKIALFFSQKLHKVVVVAYHSKGNEN